MKVIDIIKNCESTKGIKETSPCGRHGGRFSFELLPPLKGDGLEKIFSAIDSLMPYNPAFINVTCHREEMKYVERPDGLIERHVVRRRPGTTGVCAAIKNKYKTPPPTPTPRRGNNTDIPLQDNHSPENVIIPRLGAGAGGGVTGLPIEVVPHVICGGQTKYDIEDTLIDLDFLGIQNVLALRGDAMPGTHRFVPNKEGHAHADALVEQIMEMNRGNYIDGEPNTHHKTDFCVGVAGYPEKHVESPNSLTDLGYLKQKVDAGAEYIATQICYDSEKIIRFRDDCDKAGIHAAILPGLKPFATKTQLTVLPQTFAVDLPQELVEKVLACKDNDDVKKVGVEWAIRQGEALLKAGFPVLHFYTMTRTQQVQAIVSALFGENKK